MFFVKISGLRNSFQLEKVEIMNILKWMINRTNSLYGFYF